MTSSLRPFESYELWELEMIAAGDWQTPIAPALLCYARQQTADPLEKELRGALYRLDCPSPFDLAAWRMALLPDGEAQPLAQHVDGCPACQAELSQLDPADMPAISLAQRLGSVARRIAMKVVNRTQPSGAGGAVAIQGVRGILWGATYSGGDFTVSLMKRQSEEGTTLVGGLLGNESEMGAVYLCERLEVVAMTPLTAASTFSFPYPPAGNYDLLIRTGDDELQIADLRLEE